MHIFIAVFVQVAGLWRSLEVFGAFCQRGPAVQAEALSKVSRCTLKSLRHLSVQQVVLAGQALGA